MITPIEYQMRGGEHPNKRINEMEKEVVENAIRLFNSDPKYIRKGIKWCYNYLYFRSIYASQNPEMLKYLYEVRPYPEYIEIENTTFCDLRCSMCEHTYWKEKNLNMDFEDFKKIIKMFPRLGYIGLTGIGESYMNKDFHLMIKYLKEKYEGIYVELFDNFLHLDRKKAKDLISMDIDKMYVSLDAATKETFDKIRVGSNWDKVIKNIKDFDKEKKRQKNSFPDLCFHFIVSKDNRHELKKYIDFVHNLDVDAEFIQFTILLHPYKEIKDKFIEIDNQEKREVIEYAHSLGIKATWNMNSSDTKQTIDKCSVWTMPFIFADGDITPCCSLNEQNDRPWQRKNKMGNVFEKGMREIWYGKTYTDMLNDLKQNKCPSACARCRLYKMPK